MTTTRNGTAAFLGGPLTRNYRPSLYRNIGGMGGSGPGQVGPLGLFNLGQVDVMRRDPQIQFTLLVLRAPLHRVKWEVESPDARVADYVDTTLQRFWDRSLTHVLSMLEFANAAGEVVWKEEDGHVCFDKFREVYPRDAEPLQSGGQMAGLRINHTGEPGTGYVDLFPPRAAWFTNDAEFGSFWGRSRLFGTWEPWCEKRGRHGAIDARRLWYVKNAFRGGVLRHPDGTIEDEASGMVRSCQDYARELLEKMETGGILTLPNTKDEEGNYQWIYEPPASNGDLRDVRDYPKDLDAEILLGAGIPPEVVRAAETGSGWSGRSVPFMVFLSGEDLVAANIIDTVDRQIIKPGVAVNFGTGAKYQIHRQSLLDILKGDEPPTGEPAGVARQGEQAPGSGLQPYRGPRGGQGMVDPATGRVRYGMSQNEPPEVIVSDRIRNRVRRLARQRFSTFDESEHPRGQPGNAGQFGDKPGGASGGSGKSTKAKKSTESRTSWEAANSVGHAHYNKQAGMIRDMIEGKYDPTDLIEDSQIYLRKASRAIGNAYQAHYQMLTQQVATHFGPEATTSEEWAHVYEEFVKASAATKEVLGRMADETQALASWWKDHEGKPDQKLSKGDIDALRAHTADVENSVHKAFLGPLGDAIEAFKKTWKQRETAAKA